ncbi:MAG TPA: NAD-dependent epimerase/dehydratase family protein [Burkholderiales bacterium]|nr:NAD-dependent epimerase/dehydratase family protein [Burkholderiales bacterium]
MPGYALAIVDNLANSKRMVFDRLREITPAASMTFRQADVRDAAALERIFFQAPIDAVIHFATMSRAA